MRESNRFARVFVSVACFSSVAVLPSSTSQAISGEPDVNEERTCLNCGDTNLSGSVTVADIGPMVAAIAGGFEAWRAAIGRPNANLNEFYCVADMNWDGLVSVSDIGPFVATITSGIAVCGD